MQVVLGTRVYLIQAFESGHPLMFVRNDLRAAYDFCNRQLKASRALV